MPWDDLKAIIDTAKRDARDERRPPTACPIDGTPLQDGAKGVKNCPMGNYRWPR